MILNHKLVRRLKAVLLLAFALQLVSCSHSPQIKSYVGDAPPELPPHFTGTWSVWHKNGKLCKRTPYVDGKKHGTEITWNSEGRKLTAIDYSNGIFHGSAITYFPNGRIQYLSKAEMGHGILMADYFDNGQIKSEAQRKDHCHDGLVRSWYRNGQLQWEARYSMGVQVGKSRSWYENGKLKSEDEWAHGQKHGSHKYWDATGKLIASGLYWHGEEVEGTFVDGLYGKTEAHEAESPYKDYARIDTATIIKMLEEADIAHLETTHGQKINIILKDGRKYRGLYQQPKSGKYSEDGMLFDIYNLVRYIFDKRDPKGLENTTMSIE
jgi:antitoxin component YwqK of YwqJK toxin-antitoxin module